MPNSDTWPRAVSVETLSNMDSARSCDSVISVNSACSEDSMEHLSAEEKACLMYLEETIESLDLQEDSGFSNDEPDSANLRRAHGDSETLPEPVTCSNILSVLAVRGSDKTKASCEPDNPVSDSQFFAPDICDPPSHIPPDPTPAATDLASGSATPVPAPLSTELTLSSDGDSQSSAAEAVLSAKASGDVDMSFIPPPSDFMDEPVPPSSPQTDSGASSPAPKTINLEVLRRRVSEKNIPVSTPLSPVSLSPSPVNSNPVSQALARITSVNPAPISPVPVNPTSINPTPVDLAPVISTHPSPAPQEKPAVELPAPLLSNLSIPQTEASPGPAEPKSPPAVAPKPKKLPPNIILKSHKSTAGYESSMGHPSPGTPDRLLMDPQKVRMEALRKLGLLKSEESDSGPAPKPVQTRRPWTPASSPLSPTPPKSAPPSMPYTSSVHSSPVHTPVPASAQTPSASPHVQSEAFPDIIPVPAAFSDPVEDMFVGVSDKSSSPLNKKLSLSTGGGVKSATLERSGLGLSSYMESLEQDKQTLGQLRNSRPRPASLGCGKDFSSARGVASSEAEREKPAPSSSDSSQKLPRSQGISVLICPRAQSEESRREALKKLGLLRD